MFRSAVLSGIFLSICGCAGLTTPHFSARESAARPPSDNLIATEKMVLERFVRVMDSGNTPIEVDKLVAGQTVRIISSVDKKREDRKDGRDDVAVYFGTIESVENDSIVLKDALLVKEQRQTRGTPVLHKVPYVSRVFKRTGLGTSYLPLPDGVTVPRSKIVTAFPATTVAVDRIGVDFDFNVQK